MFGEATEYFKILKFFNGFRDFNKINCTILTKLWEWRWVTSESPASCESHPCQGPQGLRSLGHVCVKLTEGIAVWPSLSYLRMARLGLSPVELGYLTWASRELV